MKNLIYFLALAVILSLNTSCGKDSVTPDACNATLFNENINPRLMAWQEAATNYANDQSTANCEAYKSTGQSWLDAIRSYEGCATLYTVSWREAVDEAKAELAALACN